MLIKVCGITNQQDALLAAELGASALGFIFAETSPRIITAEKAGSIIAALPPFVTTVGVFVNTPAQEIFNILDQTPLQILQFHGDETEDDCKQFHKPYIKAFRIKPDSNISGLIEKYSGASAVLLDTFADRLYGGTGVRFDWRKIPADHTKPIILAGGITPANVAQAVQQVRPYAIDVNSGIEKYPGKKDPAKLTALFDEVKKACHAKD